MGYVDLHSHVLFGLDDGPSDLEGSLALASALIDLGFDTICVTPHQRLGLYTPELSAVRSTAAALQDALDEKGYSAKLIPGAESCWDDLLWERSRNGEIPCYGETRAFLFDLPAWVIPSELDQQLFQWRLKELVPVIGHVERYDGTDNLFERCEELKQHAVLTVNLDALGGKMGRSTAKVARRLVNEGLVQALSSDLHDVSSLKPTRDGLNWVMKRLGPDRARKLLDENPRMALSGELPE